MIASWIAKITGMITAGIGLLTINDVAAITGIILSGAAFWYSKRQQDRRTAMLSQALAAGSNCITCPKNQDGD